MTRRDPWQSRGNPILRAATLAVIVLFTAASIALAGRPGLIKGDPDSAGSIPYVGAPNPMITVPLKTTIGLVVDAERHPAAGVPVVVMHQGEMVIVQAVTSASGIFSFQLPEVSGMTLSLPMNGIFDLPVEAGVPIVVVVP